MFCFFPFKAMPGEQTGLALITNKGTPKYLLLLQRNQLESAGTTPDKTFYLDSGIIEGWKK